MRTRQESHRALNWLLPFCLLLLVSEVSIAQAQEGQARIKDGRGKYNNAYFEDAIRNLQEAIRDTSLDYGDSTIVYSYLAASCAKLQQVEERDRYFRIILRRNINAKLLNELEEFGPDFEKIRAEVVEFSRRLAVNSTPEGATVYLDGYERGQTPLTIEYLQTYGTYEVKVKKAGYDTRQTDITMDKDTSLVIDLTQATSKFTETSPLPPTVVYTQPGVRSYAVGLSAGVALGLASYFASVQFDNMAADRVKAYNMAGDSAYAEELKGKASQYHSLGSVFYYSSYPLIAVGFYVGLKLSERVSAGKVSFLGDDSPTRVCCSLDKDLNLSLGVRRSIW